MLMGSRYVTQKVLDYCFHPVLVLKDDGRVIQVPCGKCNGCLLHRQNEWSMRVATEIEYNPYTIFFTLTYNNYYLPKLLVRNFFDDEGNILHRDAISNHPDNIRFDSVRDVLREDNIVVPLSLDMPYSFNINNFERKDYINYMSKRDVQLWLKILRRKIETYLCPNDKGNFFRYYIISEIGPTTSRCHAHGLFFCSSREISEYLLQRSLYESWKMCDSVRFNQFCRYTDSGSAQYVSNYVSSVDSLPSYYRHSSIRPWRLASKAPSIGYSEFDLSEVQNRISVGDMQYIRSIRRIEQQYTLSYPKGYLSRIFPKSYRFSLLSFNGLLWVYGLLYRDVIGRKVPYSFASKRLSYQLRSSDLDSTRACYRFCLRFGCTPFHYLYILDLVYYKLDMFNLKRWYEWQQVNCNYPLRIIASYCNIQDYFVPRIQLSDYQFFVISEFCNSFSMDYLDLSPDDFDYINGFVENNEEYENEVFDLLVNRVKVAKYNEMSGNAPHDF